MGVACGMQHSSHEAYQKTGNVTLRGLVSGCRTEVEAGVGSGVGDGAGGGGGGEDRGAVMWKITAKRQRTSYHAVTESQPSAFRKL